MLRSPASMTAHFELSMTTGTRATAGSEATRRRKWAMAASESSSASSMLTSMAWAPASTWRRAISRARSKLPSTTRRAKAREPATFVLSPMFANRLPGAMSSGSRPARRRAGGGPGMTRGGRPRTASAKAAMWAGPVPQQPPTMLTRPASAKPRISLAMASGVSS